MKVALVPIGPYDVRLARLMQLYIHEWSGLIPIAIGADGLYKAPDYTGPEERRIYLVHDEAGALVGFAVAEREEEAWAVEEFFILEGARRRGAGLAAAAALFATQAGPWTFTVREENPRALAFWRRVLPGAPEEDELGKDGVTRTRFRLSR